jgi:diguanylate cyclase (GGDEF)-like protein
MADQQLPAHTVDLAPALAEWQKVDALNILARELRELDAKRGLELAQEAYELAQVGHYLKGLVDSLANQSHCYSWLSNVVDALARGLEALRESERLGDYPNQADLLFALSRVQLNLANFSESVELGRRAQKLAQEVGDRLTEADALNVLGINYYRSGTYDLAFAVYTEGLALYRAMGNQHGACKVFINIAQAYSTLEKYDQALAFGHEGLAIVRAINSRMLEGYTLHTLGQIYADKGAFEQAIEYLQLSLPIAGEIGDQYLYLVSIVAIGQVYARWQQQEVAVAHFQQALALAEELKSRIYVFRCHKALAEFYESQGSWQQALTHYKQFHTVKETVFNEENVSRLQSLEIRHQIEIARKETELYHLRSVALEQEVAERKRLEEELQHQATTDVLTNISNRRHFIALAHTEVQRAVRLRRPLALALIDLDYFKQINDTYGHAVGDRALIALARICQSNIRPLDIFARFGGDEFVLLLPETNREQAYTVVERIRQLLTAQPTDVDGQAVSLSISSGIAGLSSAQESLDSLLARADQALYQAKGAGRNRVGLMPDP